MILKIWQSSKRYETSKLGYNNRIYPVFINVNQIYEQQPSFMLDIACWNIGLGNVYMSGSTHKLKK